MATKKTAVSLEETLLEQVDTLAEELNVSRSRLFVMAIEEFLQRHHDRQMLEAFNTVYDDQPSPDEQELYQRRRARYRKMIEGQW
jgi:metal-responsive CopG/Arc/MetJ family transcriptional regulator